MKNNESSSMKELMVIKNDDNILIDARLLHQKLKSGYQFADWIQSRIKEFGFKENEDYFRNFGISQKGKSAGGRNRNEYNLTMDMAKELAMLERNDIGRSIRRYFIKSEKEARQFALPFNYDLPKQLPIINLNGRQLVPYREYLVSLGCKPGGGAYGRKKRYPNHFIVFNGKDHITEDLAKIIAMQTALTRKRNIVKLMQPVLPLEFLSPIQLKGGPK